MDKNLSAFLAVARHGTLTDASDHLGLTQPSVTKRIANLEQELGADLFERHRRGMSLTAAGEVFLQRARKIEREYRQSREEVAAIGSAGLTVLRVGAGPLFHFRYVSELFAELKTDYPNLRLELTTDTKYPIGQLLSEGVLDVYMGVIPPEHLDDTIFVRYITQVEHGIVVRSDDPHARLDRIDPAGLKGYSWVIFAVDPETERTIRKYCLPKTALAPTIDVRTTSFATGLQLVQEGTFVMSAPLQLAQRIENEGLVVRPTLQGMPHRPAGLYVRKSAMGFGVIKSILDFFEKIDVRG